MYANQYLELTQYMNSLVDYFEFKDKNGSTIVCCHGWLPENCKDKDCKDFEEYSWINGMAYWKNGHNFKDKTIIIALLAILNIMVKVLNLVRMLVLNLSEI